MRGLGRLFTGHFIGAFVETLGAFAVLGFLFLVVRLLTELLAALHRLNDRLTILGDDLRSIRNAEED